jgi:hypothetical protein
MGLNCGKLVLPLSDIEERVEFPTPRRLADRFVAAVIDGFEADKGAGFDRTVAVGGICCRDGYNPVTEHLPLPHNRSSHLLSCLFSLPPFM